jgi:NAD-dependent deacetylase
MAVASIYGFRQNPKAFYDWIHPLARMTVNAQPNPAHYALAQLEAKDYLKAVITQNIDLLHSRAGSKTVYELHGHLREVTCIHCFTVYLAEPIIRKFLEDKQVPICPRCQSVLKPNVILFGEQLPVEQFLKAKEAVYKADVLIVVGSSLEVAPASDLPLWAVRNGAKLIIINLEATMADTMAHIVIHADAAEVLPEIAQLLETV